MEIQEIKRSYLPLILFIISIGTCIIAMKNFKAQDIYLNDKIYQKRMAVSQYREPNYDDYAIYDKELDNIEVYYALLLTFFVLILSFYMVFNNNYILAILYLFISWMIITDGDGVGTHIYTQELNNSGVMKFLLFSPYIYYIYSKLIKGKTVDNTNLILSRNHYDFSKKNHELEHLKIKNIISEDQYLAKLIQLKKEKIKSELYLTDEYKSLKSLRDSNLFSQEEFENKINEIIDKKLNDKI